jgi:hypothetical protein
MRYNSSQYRSLTHIFFSTGVPLHESHRMSQGLPAQGYQVTSKKESKVQFLHLLICNSKPILQVLRVYTGYHIKEMPEIENNQDSEPCCRATSFSICCTHLPANTSSLNRAALFLARILIAKVLLALWSKARAKAEAYSVSVDA